MIIISLYRYSDDLKDRKECDCLNDCEMVHFFSTMQRQPYNEMTTESDSRKWFTGDHSGTTGILADYLMDTKHRFVSQLAKNITKLAFNLSHDHQLAQKRFDEVRNVILEIDYTRSRLYRKK